MTSRFRKVLAALVATMAVTGVAIGGIAQASGTGAHTSAVHHKKHHKKHKNRIPQHNGGDHDADNNGGPSDGDGNI
jgi:hypothetical protein